MTPSPWIPRRARARRGKEVRDEPPNPRRRSRRRPLRRPFLGRGRLHRTFRLGAALLERELRLDDFALAGGGGPVASIGAAAHDAAQPFAGAEIASAQYRATLGFLGAWDPQAPPTPIVFGVSPECGPTVGLSIVTISGMNFTLAGSGPTVTAQIGASPVVPLFVLSNTTAVGLTSAGSAGDKPVTVSSSLGSSTLENGFHYTAGLQPYGSGSPGCIGPHLVGANDCPTVGNAGFRITCELAPPNALGLGIVGAAQDVVGHDPLGLGILFHVDLFLSGSSLLGLNAFSDALGHGEAVAPIPANPAIVGSTLYAQIVWSWSSCALPPFNLSSTPGLRISFEL